MPGHMSEAIPDDIRALPKQMEVLMSLQQAMNPPLQMSPYFYK